MSVFRGVNIGPTGAKGIFALAFHGHSWVVLFGFSDFIDADPSSKYFFGC